MPQEPVSLSDESLRRDEEYVSAGGRSITSTKVV